MMRTQTSQRVVPQIVNQQGQTAAAKATSNLWVASEVVFSQPQRGNKVKALTTGKDYFADLIGACASASKEIYIIGWQVNWDAMLAPGKRVWDVLLDAARRGIHVYVLPWDDTNPVQTYDDQTASALRAINDHLGLSRKERRVHVALASSYATKNNSYFSHHQKLVVIDRKIAYVGGMDLAYGRYDDAAYDLNAAKDGRTALNRYNPCVAWVGKLDKKDRKLVDPDLLTGAVDNTSIPLVMRSNSEEVLTRIAEGAYQVPYGEASKLTIGVNSVGVTHRAERNPPLYATLDPTRQPRMPWQDVHCRIEGPTVADLVRNFVVRWNVVGDPKLPMPAPYSSYGKPGSVQVQVLRSAPAGMRKAESKAAGVQLLARGPETDIHQAMLQLIAKSQRFIYIESQFFVSAFGSEADFGGELSPAAQYINDLNGADANGSARLVAKMDADADVHAFRLKVDTSAVLRPPTNGVCTALVDRISRAILDRANPDYHVYITLPVHPEGQLLNATIAVQVYWTMQTLVFGSKSLLNGIRRALKAKELRDKNDRNFMRVINDENNREYETIPREACFKYVTLLNLRNWQKLGERYVTEQIYVHSKLMIVDDLYALIGSANINDRSLLGERDSEIAVLIADENHCLEDVCGNGKPRPVRKFARQLRMDIWKKLFGLTGAVRPAEELTEAIKSPAAPRSWNAIQRRAKRNAATYEQAFDFVPRNKSPHNPEVPASIIPNFLPEKNPPGPSSPLPADPAFWDGPQHVPRDGSGLENIAGYVVALPIRWTEDENNRFEYPTALVADNDEKPNSSLDRTPSAEESDRRELTAADRLRSITADETA